MPAKYKKGPDGCVHLMDQSGDGEFTFCGRPTDGDLETGGFVPERSTGPATCHECREGVDEMREGMRGMRWKMSPKRAAPDAIQEDA